MMSTWSIPPALKRIFDVFPLITYPPNSLPPQCPSPDSPPLLFIFADPRDAGRGSPSFNPSCLRWQSYLLLSGIKFSPVPSNNHAAPAATGALPFLIAGGETVPANRLGKWAQEHGRRLREADLDTPEAVTFLTLLSTQVRDAWLYALYLSPRNFETLCTSLYRTTSVPPVQFLIASDTQKAAKAELQKTHPGAINPDDIYADAEAAFEALAGILGDDRWFFAGADAGMFDATVFSYTYLILTLPWSIREDRLRRIVERHKNLVEHADRMRLLCFPRTRALVG